MYDGDDSPNQYTGVQGQFDVFERAQIIIGLLLARLGAVLTPLTGPHGAGLTNMMWMRDGMDVVEFPLLPHSNRNMGFLAQMCSHRYWLVPALSSGYYGKYHVDGASADTVVRLIEKILRLRGLDKLIMTDGES